MEVSTFPQWIERKYREGVNEYETLRRFVSRREANELRERERVYVKRDAKI